MTPRSCALRAGSLLSIWLVILVSTVLWPHVGAAQFIFSGLPIENCKWKILVNEFGYSDSLLDERWKFRGREYLSGEWAAAVYYEGGMLPAKTRWLTDRFVFPDFYTPEPRFGIKQGFHFADPAHPTNSSGFPHYQSTSTNLDMEIKIDYEMLDLGTNETEQLQVGLAPDSAGGFGTSVVSGSYVFRQTYEFINISGRPLNNVRMFQFLHGLNGEWGAFDSRSYGGGMPEYHYALTQQGRSYGLTRRDYETVRHTDTLSAVFNRQPSGFELGAFGVKGVDSHQTNPPSIGVHRSVEANNLSGTDFYNPDGANWVSGALSFDLGSLAPGGKTSISALLAIHSTYESVSPPLNIVVRQATLTDKMMTIDFEETTRNPRVGYLLRQTSELGLSKGPMWDPLFLPYFVNVPKPGWYRFEVPVDRLKPQQYFFIHPQILQPAPPPPAKFHSLPPDSPERR